MGHSVRQRRSAIAILLLIVFACSESDLTTVPQDSPVTTLAPVRSTGRVEETSTSLAPVESGTAITLPPPDSPTDYGIYGDAVLFGGRVARGSVEFSNFLATCYAEYGISVRVIGPGELELAAGGQGEALQRATVECDERAKDSGLIGLGISDVPPDDVLALWYRAYVEVAYECLVDHGFPTNPPPSEATWIDNYPNVWTPHDIVGDQPDVIAVCPQDIGLLLIELGRRDSGG